MNSDVFHFVTLVAGDFDDDFGIFGYGPGLRCASTRPEALA
jgi:hypothetical protein